MSPLSQQSHGAEETFLAQEGVREEGRQEEGEAFGQAQREEARVEAPLPQAQVQEGWRRRVKQLYMGCVCVVNVFQVSGRLQVVVLGVWGCCGVLDSPWVHCGMHISVRVPLAFI